MSVTGPFTLHTSDQLNIRQPEKCIPTATRWPQTRDNARGEAEPFPLRSLAAYALLGWLI